MGIVIRVDEQMIIYDVYDVFVYDVTRYDVTLYDVVVYDETIPDVTRYNEIVIIIIMID